MAEPTPLAYALPGLPEDMLAHRVRRAVAWMAIAYGVASVMNSATEVAYYFTVPGTGYASRDLPVFLLVNVPGALLKGLAAIAGWMILARVHGGVKLLRGVCWFMVAVHLFFSIATTLFMGRIAANYNITLFSVMGSFFSGMIAAAFPGLILLLPLRRETEG